MSFVPLKIPNTCVVPKKFRTDFGQEGKNAFTTRKVYNWFKNRKLNKEDLLVEGSYVRIKGTDKYGKIVKVYNKTYKVEEMTTEEILKEALGGK